MAAREISVTVTRSAGSDGAVLVMIDTGFEPDGSDDGPGLRVLVNDEPAFEGVPFQPVPDNVHTREARSPRLVLSLGDLDYTR